jgi:hypothetical protein
MTRREALAAIGAVAGALAPLLFGAACTKEEIVLAELPPSAEGGAAVAAKRCVDVSDCAEVGFCERRDCADIAGTCQPRPVVCDEEARPVCGCDGITYWNDCERKAAGITASTTGECTTTAQVCGHNGPRAGGPPGGPAQCPPETYCARLLPPPQPGNPPPVACPLDVTGSCWALPAVCPQRAGPDRWNACGPGGSTCVTTCDAIRTGEPHRRANACP